MKKILIVDDQAAVRELVSVTLEIGPYEILTAENGDQALIMARSELPDLMLLDVQMPGSLDGLELCRTLKSSDDTRNIFIVTLTAKGQDWDKEAWEQAGAEHDFDTAFTPPSLLGR